MLLGHIWRLFEWLGMPVQGYKAFESKEVSFKDHMYTTVKSCEAFERLFSPNSGTFQVF